MMVQSSRFAKTLALEMAALRVARRWLARDPHNLQKRETVIVCERRVQTVLDYSTRLRDER